MAVRRRLTRGSERESGFTLIELLVVIIVIGVLAAIAIPVFLGQRQKGYDAGAKNDLRNLANFEEIYLNDMGSYGTLAAIGVKESPPTITRGVTLSVVRYDATNGYCLSAMHAGTGMTFFYDSAAGGMQPSGASGCPATTPGTSGDTRVG